MVEVTLRFVHMKVSR